MIKLIIADDHKIFLEGLVSILKNSDIQIVGTASNGKEVLDLLTRFKPDVVLTDVNMPIMDGIKLTQEIKKKYKDVKIIALTMHNDGRIISTLVKAGVNGYILKYTGKDELLFAIKTVADGQTYFGNEVKTALTESMMPGKKTSSASEMPELSERELEILKLVALQNTAQQIADKLFISEHTVIFHKRKLFFKLDVKNTAGLIKLASEKGLLD